MPLLQNYVPKINVDIRVRDILLSLYEEGQDLQVVESVCTVDRLKQILTESFNTIPVVNTEGALIGTIPKHFIICLIKHHKWYENTKTMKGIEITEAYHTALRRNTSQKSLEKQKVGAEDGEDTGILGQLDKVPVYAMPKKNRID